VCGVLGGLRAAGVRGHERLRRRKAWVFLFE
jgi:hypothetical protein